MKTPMKNTAAASPLPTLRILWGRKINAKENEEQILLTDAFPFQPAQLSRVYEAR